MQGLSGSWCIKGTNKSMTRVDSLVPLMHHDPDRSCITDPDPEHPKGTDLYRSVMCGPRCSRLLELHAMLRCMTMQTQLHPPYGVGEGYPSRDVL